jgi:hypothetical protein
MGIYKESLKPEGWHMIKDISKNMKRIKSYQKFRNKLFENNSEIEAICQKYSIENYTINTNACNKNTNHNSNNIHST